MRTTLNINDALLLETKKLAVERHASLKAVVEEALCSWISQLRSRQEAAASGGWPVISYAAPRQGVDLSRTSELLEAE